PKSFRSRTELINVRADFPSSLRSSLKPVSILVRNSIHGPIISDTITSLEQPVALQWTGLDDQDTSFESFYRLSYATNWDEFKQALTLHVAPPLNILFADKQNNIGLIGIGRIPIRKAGYGAVPVSGNDLSYGWDSYIPFDRMNRVFYMGSVFMVYANNSYVNQVYIYCISSNELPHLRSTSLSRFGGNAITSGCFLLIKDIILKQGDFFYF